MPSPQRNYNLTGATRYRSGWRGRLVLQVEQRTIVSYKGRLAPGVEREPVYSYHWRDAKVHDLSVLKWMEASVPLPHLPQPPQPPEDLDNVRSARPRPAPPSIDA